MSAEVTSILLDEIETQSNDDQAPLLERDMALLGHVKVQVSVVVGHVDMSIEKLFSCKEGELVQLAEAVDEPVTLMIDYKPVAKGKLVAVEDNFGVQITEIAK